MTKESIIELQKIDCNCSDCKYMIRDFETYHKWEQWNKELQLQKFEKERDHAFKVANECENPQGRESLLFLANKMKFQFDKAGLLQYGDCSKLNKKVSFIPGTCQIETQECFEHRRG